ncbi:ubiquinone anaerobic biosynthesis accessory factor UbiT [Permianibacter aggregans]|uniref:Putative lipid carrier protein YhbT n=1 Tax=Permianibacter aggregans TaxID=1510150 RepID=A0A4R6UEM0_9GAMM|nr:SCP2 sterol-binding domain-containing protein [Permianibacter aggregans]QGX40934.1 SCP2 domain-containing protein [Permianibacter aggregans]TDQ43633.1 putative lipid carrier protein YhbT [Permianibacter aggregans]
MSAMLIPQSLLPWLSRLGVATPPVLVAPLMEWMLNQWFHGALREGELALLQGKWLAIVCDELPYALRISRRHNQFIVSIQRGTIDASIHGKLEHFAQLINRQIDPDTLFFQRKLLMQGDTELALSVKNFLDRVDLSHAPWWWQKLSNLPHTAKVFSMPAAPNQ